MKIPSCKITPIRNSPYLYTGGLLWKHLNNNNFISKYIHIGQANKNTISNIYKTDNEELQI